MIEFLNFLQWHKITLTQVRAKNINRNRVEVFLTVTKSYFNELQKTNIYNYYERNVINDSGGKKLLLRKGLFYYSANENIKKSYGLFYF